jgi:hypothetical protein
MAANLTSVPNPEKCKIVTMTGEKIEVEAYFNPKELKIDKEVPWNKHKASQGDNPVLEFTDAEPMNFTVELFFDTYESREDVYTKYIKKLQTMTLIDDNLKHPPMCVFIWGNNFPRFQGVIRNLAINYTMFLSDGTPCRATCTVKMQQAVDLKRSEAGMAKDAEGKTAEAGDERRPDKYGEKHRDVLDASGSEDGQLKSGQQVNTGK